MNSKFIDLVYVHKKKGKNLMFSWRFGWRQNFLQKMNLFFKFAREMDGTKNVVVGRSVVVTFFSINFLLFQHNSRDSAWPSASLRSEKKTFFTVSPKTFFHLRQKTRGGHFTQLAAIFFLSSFFIRGA